MTISAAAFHAIGAEKLMAGQAITSADLLAIAENTHLAHHLLTGQNLPGATCTLAAHDHVSGRGAPIPLVTVQTVGQPSASRFKGSDTAISFCRMPSSQSMTLDLMRSSTPDAQVSATTASSRTAIWLSGDVTANLTGFDYLTLTDGVNTGRYLVK
jgi:hypothetical protein